MECQKVRSKENESIDHPWINKAMESAQKKLKVEILTYENPYKIWWCHEWSKTSNIFPET